MDVVSTLLLVNTGGFLGFSTLPRMFSQYTFFVSLLFITSYSVGSSEWHVLRDNKCSIRMGGISSFQGRQGKAVHSYTVFKKNVLVHTK